FRQSLRNSPSVGLHRDNITRLQDIRSPTLLVKGVGSSSWLHQVIDVLSAHIPNARVIELPGGHAAHIVSREKFMEALEQLQQ
ncbi:hypothetical protein L0244_30805, partial [bacterium]|nr:hypothetical protein [bacterium]